MFIDEYADSNLQANEPAERFKDNVFTFLKTVQVALKEPYKFEPFHQAIREPFDYYKWFVFSLSVLIFLVASSVTSNADIYLQSGRRNATDKSLAALLYSLQG